jgi:hypothetical protein
MCRWPIRLLASAVLVLGAAAANARAGVDWTYDTLSSTDKVLSDNGHSAIDFTRQATQSAVGSSDIVLVNLNASSTTADNNPDTISHGDYTLVVHLTDTASKQSTSLTFTGEITGTISGHSTLTSNTFTGATTETAMLGAYTYAVTIGPYVGPGPVGSIPGSIGAEVMVEPGCHQAVEPSSLVLGTLGIGCLGLIIRRRR